MGWETQHSCGDAQPVSLKPLGAEKQLCRVCAVGGQGGGTGSGRTRYCPGEVLRGLTLLLVVAKLPGGPSRGAVLGGAALPPPATQVEKTPVTQSMFLLIRDN